MALVKYFMAAFMEFCRFSLLYFRTKSVWKNFMPFVEYNVIKCVQQVPIITFICHKRPLKFPWSWVLQVLLWSLSCVRFPWSWVLQGLLWSISCVRFPWSWVLQGLLWTLSCVRFPWSWVPQGLLWSLSCVVCILSALLWSIPSNPQDAPSSHECQRHLLVAVSLKGNTEAFIQKKEA